MVKTYKVGDVAVFNIVWLSQTGEEATVTGTPTITIKKYTPSTDTWSTEVSAANMTQQVGSQWYYEYDTVGETAEFDYKVVYSAVVDTLTVEASEDFRIISTLATQADVRELRLGNQRITFTKAVAADVGRNVVIGAVDYMTILTKADTDSDWASPTSTKILYLYYDSAGFCTEVREND